MSDFESYTESKLREFSTRGAAVTPPLRSTDDDEIIFMETFRFYVGRIMFVVGKTEPIISNDCRELTSHITAPNEEHWKALARLIGYLKTGDHQSVKMRQTTDRRVVAFVDSDYASYRNDRKRIAEFLVTIGGCLFSWQSKKQSGVTLSSTEAEFVVISSMAATEIKFVVSVLTEIYGKKPLEPSILKEDNTGAILMAKNTAIGQRTKHVDVRCRFVNKMVQDKTLFIEYIRSGNNPSDGMTKNKPPPLFGKHAPNISEGLLGQYYEPANPEDVNAYGATVLEFDGTPRRQSVPYG